MKNLDWNAAIIGDETYTSQMKSEVYHNYIKIMKMQKEAEMAEQKMLLEKQAQKEREDFDKQVKDSDELIKSAMAILAEPEEKGYYDDELESNNDSKDHDECDLYKDQNAGESDHIEIGITPETEKLMEDGIDYCEPGDGCKKEISEEEIEEAEKDLGLYSNSFYILHQLVK
jgi:hypothetical protein